MILLSVYVTAGSTSCSNSVDLHYSKAFESLQRSVTKDGIPREKVFYEFQLHGVPSKRIGQSGIRGGRTTAWEEWQLPSGSRLVASKSTYVGNDWKVSPFSESGSPFVAGRGFMLKQEYYSEPRLEPFFDTVVLLGRSDEEIRRFELPGKLAEQDVPPKSDRAGG